jgi:hypothetical protein
LEVEGVVILVYSSLSCLLALRILNVRPRSTTEAHTCEAAASTRFIHNSSALVAISPFRSSRMDEQVATTAFMGYRTSETWGERAETRTRRWRCRLLGPCRG